MRHGRQLSRLLLGRISLISGVLYPPPIKYRGGGRIGRIEPQTVKVRHGTTIIAKALSELIPQSCAILLLVLGPAARIRLRLPGWLLHELFWIEHLGSGIRQIVFVKL